MHSSQPNFFASSLTSSSSSSSTYNFASVDEDPFRSSTESPVYRGMSTMVLPETSIHNSFDLEQFSSTHQHPVNQHIGSFQPTKQNASDKGQNQTNLKQLQFDFASLTIPQVVVAESNDKTFDFPVVPVHVERYSSLFLDTTAPDAFELVRSSITQARDIEGLRLDYQIENNNASFSCLSWDCRNENLTFQINLYKTNTPASVLVEVQKLKGCSIVFNKFYGTFSAQLYQSAQDKKLNVRQYESSSKKSSPRFLSQPTFISRPVVSAPLTVNVTPNPDSTVTPNPDAAANEIFILASMSSPHSSYENIKEALCALSSPQISYTKVAEAAYKSCSANPTPSDDKAVHPCKIMSNIITFLSEDNLPAELVCSALHVLSSLASKAKEENREKCMRGRLTTNPQLLQVLKVHLKGASSSKSNIYAQEIQRSILTLFATFPCWLDDETKQEAKLYSLQSRDSQLPQWVKDTLNGL